MGSWGIFRPIASGLLLVTSARRLQDEEEGRWSPLHFVNHVIKVYRGLCLFQSLPADLSKTFPKYPLTV